VQEAAYFHGTASAPEADENLTPAICAAYRGSRGSLPMALGEPPEASGPGKSINPGSDMKLFLLDHFFYTADKENCPDFVTEIYQIGLTL
jgi:hypothetical protein